MPTVNEISLKYREQFLKNQATFEGQFRGVFNKVAQDISRLAADPNAKFTKAFNFNKPIKVKIDGIMQNFQNQTLGLTEKMISDSWDISNNKNDEITNNFLKTVTGLKTAETASYFMPNTPALEAFISRANNATTLADTVWNISKQARAEMETFLGIGIVNGDSANVISQRIRQFLENPQSLFRRVRDKNGKLIASQAMRENKPGQGVYNSAYKNAMRTARSETNQAYLLSDNLRWQQNDLVLGVRISLSDAHKIVDICDDLIGDYPKYFVWVGWHPQDLCNATPILMPKADFEKYLQSGGKLPKGKQITEMPENFKEYMKANIDRFEGYKSQPYFMTDNKAIIDNIVKGGAKNVVSPIAGIVEKATAVRIPEPEIFAKWGTKIDRNILNLLESPIRVEETATGSYARLKENLVRISTPNLKTESRYALDKNISHEIGHLIHNQKNIITDSAVSEKYSSHFLELRKMTAKLNPAKIEEEISQLYKTVTYGSELDSKGILAEFGFANRYEFLEARGGTLDALMSLTNSKYGGGHTKAYMSRYAAKEMEMFAHSVENRFVGNSIFEKVMPDVYKESINFIKSLEK